MNPNKSFIENNTFLTKLKDPQPELSLNVCSLKEVIPDVIEVSKIKVDVDVSSITEDIKVSRELREFNNARGCYLKYEIHDANNNILTDLNIYGMVTNENSKSNFDLDVMPVPKPNNPNYVEYPDYIKPEIGVVNNVKILTYDNIKCDEIDSKVESDVACDKNSNLRSNSIESNNIYNFDIDFQKFNYASRDIVNENYNIASYSTNAEDDTACVVSVDSVLTCSYGEMKYILDAKSLGSNDNEDHKHIADPADESDVCSGYCSSDFEFIDESEAKKGGLVTKHKCSGELFNSDKVKILNGTIDNERDSGVSVDLADAGQCLTTSNTIPMGTAYYDLFKNKYVPLPSRCMDSRPVHTVSQMLVQYEGVGFDMQLLDVDSGLNYDYKQEADESIKIIYSMYPQENPRHLRRHK